MSKIERNEVYEEGNHSGPVKAGDYCFLSYCVGNAGGPDGLQFRADAIAYCG